jgi:hypothetical protein
LAQCAYLRELPSPLFTELLRAKVFSETPLTPQA